MPRPRPSGTEDLTNIFAANYEDAIAEGFSDKRQESTQKLAFTPLLIRGFVTGIQRSQTGVTADNITLCR